MPFDERCATDLDQRLGQGVGQGREALAATGGKDHGFHKALPRFSAGVIIEAWRAATDVVTPTDLALFAAC